MATVPSTPPSDIERIEEAAPVSHRAGRDERLSDALGRVAPRQSVAGRSATAIAATRPTGPTTASHVCARSLGESSKDDE